MPSVPRVTADEAIKAFCQAGFVVDRVGKGHRILKKPGHRFHLSIPYHPGKTIGLGLLKRQIDAAGLTVEQFIKLHEETR
jgi:predicted RNA binding protein YcfA (HicA-like mRNA interferase family)